MITTGVRLFVALFTCVTLALAGIGLALGVAAGSAAVGVLAADTASCDVTVAPPVQGTTLLAADGRTVLARIADIDRQDVTLAAVPVDVQQALLDTEDRTFYRNDGVDVHSLVRAAVADVAGGGQTQGGSTITMQYVKEFEAAHAATAAAQAAAVRQDLHRKIDDAECALQLTHRYAKRQILQAYLNLSFFGQDAYGIQAAAQAYFGEPAADLTLDQGALLVGLLQDPAGDDPLLDPAGATARRGQVLAAMVSAGDLTAARAAALARAPLGLAPAPAVAGIGCAQANPTIRNAGFFCDYALSWLQRTLGLAPSQLASDDLTVRTTLDVAEQDHGQWAVWHRGLSAASPTALVMPSLDPATGDVRTMITSRHYGTGRGATTLPLFTAAYAGAGSTYKYFTTVAALEAGASPGTTLTTGAQAYRTRACPAPYTVHNDGTYRPTLALADALPESANTYFVGVEDRLFGCDLAPIVSVARTLGMDALDAPEPGDPAQTIAQAVVAQHQASFTLGYSPTSALQLAAAYGAAAHDGVYCPPRPVTAAWTAAGHALALPAPACRSAYPAAVAHTVLRLLSGDTGRPDGTAYGYFRDWYGTGGSVVASKTGTDSDSPAGADHGTGNSALWFVGVTPHLVAAAALVDPDHPNRTVTGLPRSIPNDGNDVYGAYAATFWLAAYQDVLRAHPWDWPAAYPPTPTPAPSSPTSTPARTPSTSPAPGTPSPSPSRPRRHHPG